MVQIAVPSREEDAHYQQERENLERLIGEVNGQHATVGRAPIHYLYQSVSPDELVALYLAADVMLVTPLRDGMNLVAKEYVACRVDGTGALVLSEFAGAAQELRGAILVNPHDLDGLKDAIRHGVTLDPGDAKARMRRMRQVIRRSDVHAWAEVVPCRPSRGVTAPRRSRPPPSWSWAEHKAATSPRSDSRGARELPARRARERRGSKLLCVVKGRFGGAGRPVMGHSGEGKLL